MNPNDLPLDQIENDLARYEYGRDLRIIVRSPGWEVLVDTIRSYRDKSIGQLIGMDPGDPRVPTAHAAASALNDFINKFIEDIQSAVDFADNPSAELRAYLSGVREASDVAKAMGQEI